MPPDFTFHNKADKGLIHAVFFCQHSERNFLWDISCAHVPHCIVCQFRHSMLSASLKQLRVRTRNVFIAALESLRIKSSAVRVAHCAAPFSCHVYGVIQCCAKKQMRWIAASPVIAGVANKQESRFNSIMEEVCDSICSQAPATYVRLPVASSETAASPLPAFTVRALSWRLINAAPKEINPLRREVRKSRIRFSQSVRASIALNVAVRAFRMFQHSGSPINTGILSYLAPTR